MMKLKRLAIVSILGETVYLLHDGRFNNNKELRWAIEDSVSVCINDGVYGLKNIIKRLTDDYEIVHIEDEPLRVMMKGELA